MFVIVLLITFLLFHNFPTTLTTRIAYFLPHWNHIYIIKHTLFYLHIVRKSFGSCVTCTGQLFFISYFSTFDNLNFLFLIFKLFLVITFLVLDNLPTYLFFIFFLNFNYFTILLSYFNTLQVFLFLPYQA